MKVLFKVQIIYLFIYNPLFLQFRHIGANGFLRVIRRDASSSALYTSYLGYKPHLIVISLFNEP